MTENRRTWPLCLQDARAAAWDHFTQTPGEDEDGDDRAAWEFAEWHHDVIYHFHALDVYADSSHVRDYLDVCEGMTDDESTPETIASVCLTFALRDAFTETIRGFREDSTHSDSVLANAERMRRRLRDGNACVEWDDMVARERRATVTQ